MAELALTPNSKTRLWFPTARKQSAVQSEGVYRRTRRMNVMVSADPDRRAQNAVICFPEVGAVYVIEDATQLRAVIFRLQRILGQIEAKGQGKVVSFEERYG